MSSAIHSVHSKNDFWYPEDLRVGRPRLKWVDEVSELIFNDVVNNESITADDRLFFHVAYDCNDNSNTPYDHKNALHRELVQSFCKKPSVFDPGQLD